MSEATAGGWRKLLAISGSKNGAVTGERLPRSPPWSRSGRSPADFPSQDEEE